MPEISNLTGRTIGIISKAVPYAALKNFGSLTIEVETEPPQSFYLVISSIGFDSGQLLGFLRTQARSGHRSVYRTSEDKLFVLEPTGTTEVGMWVDLLHAISILTGENSRS